MIKKNDFGSFRDFFRRLHRMGLLPKYHRSIIIQGLWFSLGAAILLSSAGCTCDDEEDDPDVPPLYYIDIQPTPGTIFILPGQGGQATATLRKTATKEAISATWVVTPGYGHNDLIESYQVQPSSPTSSITIKFTTKVIFKSDKKIFAGEGNPNTGYGLKASFKEADGTDREYEGFIPVALLTAKLQYVLFSFSVGKTANTLTFNNDFEIVDDPSSWNYVFEADSHASFAGIKQSDIGCCVCIPGGRQPPDPPTGRITITQLGPKKARVSVEQGIGSFWPYLDPAVSCRWDFIRGYSDVAVNVYVEAYAQQSPNLRLSTKRESYASP